MELNKYIDHTNLKPYTTKENIEKLCNEAVEYGFASVCVNPYYVKLASELLKDTNIAICTVIGFPLGQNTIDVKEFEAINAVQNGADEIDMVINIGALKDKKYDYVKKEIETIRDSIDGKILKIIIETCYLTEEEIAKMTEICTRGASLEDMKIINEHKMDYLEVKASGGIKNYNDATSFIEAGATRLGTSSGIEIMNSCNNENCKCEEE